MSYVKLCGSIDDHTQYVHYTTVLYETISTCHLPSLTQLTLPEGTQPRWGHTLTACSVCPGRVHATTFGGVPEGQLEKSDDAKQKLAETTVMEFGK